MKKKILWILMTIMTIPFIVSAKESCTIVSGSGKNVGSEIACGTERFYVIENKDSSLKLLAKYNLDVGLIYQKIDVTEDYTAHQEEYHLQNYCEEKYGSWSEDDSSDRKFCIIWEEIEKPTGIQSTKAIGAHGDKSGNPGPEEYGVILQRENNKNFINLSKTYSNYYSDGELYDFTKDGYSNYETILPHLNFYKNYLKSQNIEVKNIDIITVEEINNIVKSVSNKELPLADWNPDDWANNDNIISGTSSGSSDFLVGSIKDYLPKGYEWIYSTTYWTRIVIPTDIYDAENYIYFVDTLGNLCNARDV